MNLYLISQNVFHTMAPLARATLVSSLKALRPAIQQQAARLRDADPQERQLKDLLRRCSPALYPDDAHAPGDLPAKAVELLRELARAGGGEGGAAVRTISGAEGVLPGGWMDPADYLPLLGWVRRESVVVPEDPAAAQRRGQHMRYLGRNLHDRWSSRQDQLMGYSDYAAAEGQAAENWRGEDGGPNNGTYPNELRPLKRARIGVDAFAPASDSDSAMDDGHPMSQRRHGRGVPPAERLRRWTQLPYEVRISRPAPAQGRSRHERQRERQRARDRDRNGGAGEGDDEALAKYWPTAMPEDQPALDGWRPGASGVSNELGRAYAEWEARHGRRAPPLLPHDAQMPYSPWLPAARLPTEAEQNEAEDMGRARAQAGEQAERQQPQPRQQPEPQQGAQDGSEDELAGDNGGGGETTRARIQRAMAQQRGAEQQQAGERAAAQRRAVRQMEVQRQAGVQQQEVQRQEVQRQEVQRQEVQRQEVQRRIVQQPAVPQPSPEQGRAAPAPAAPVPATAEPATPGLAAQRDRLLRQAMERAAARQTAARRQPEGEPEGEPEGQPARRQVLQPAPAFEVADARFDWTGDGPGFMPAQPSRPPPAAQRPARPQTPHEVMRPAAEQAARVHAARMRAGEQAVVVRPPSSPQQAALQAALSQALTARAPVSPRPAPAPPVNANGGRPPAPFANILRGTGEVAARIEGAQSRLVAGLQHVRSLANALAIMGRLEHITIKPHVDGLGSTLAGLQHHLVDAQRLVLGQKNAAWDAVRDSAAAQAAGGQGPAEGGQGPAAGGQGPAAGGQGLAMPGPPAGEEQRPAMPGPAAGGQGPAEPGSPAAGHGRLVLPARPVSERLERTP